MNYRALMATVAALALTASVANATTYLLDSSIGTVGVSSVTGSITTDGALGALTLADITDWNILIQGNGTLDMRGPLSGNDSNDFYGLGLTATPTGLFFNFDDAANRLVFQTTTGTGSGYLDLRQGTEAVFAGFGFQSVSQSGNVEIASVASGVPEPATWAMMMAGVFGLGGLLRGRRGKPAEQSI